MEKTAVLETTVAVISHSDTITIDTVELIIPPSQFISLIKDVSNILSKVIELYRSAQHNKNITRILVERISVASASINVLHARDDLLTSTYYKILQRLVQVLHNMKEYIEEITQYNTVQKFLGTEMIEKKFKELCKEYDSLQLSKFQKVLAECINDVKQKVTHTNDQMNLIVERVSEMAITMQSMQSNMKIMGGYREKFTSGTDIPKKYQELVNKSVDPNPGYRPIFSKVLTDLQDIFRSLETPTNYPNSLNSNITPPVQKMTQGTIAAIEDCAINLDLFNTDWTDWNSFDYMTLDKAIEFHKKDSSKYYINENELGNYYMISAANKGYEQAINYCKKKNISY
ncbi:4460_t:CDS:2 [Rhizophagus irregularis]|nr:4460_t:CDS:2 [Rhizophagus irregularis]